MYRAYLQYPEPSGSVSTNTVKPSPMSRASLGAGVEKLAMLGGSLLNTVGIGNVAAL